jgi:hypothetical protein
MFVIVTDSFRVCNKQRRLCATVTESCSQYLAQVREDNTEVQLHKHRHSLGVVLVLHYGRGTQRR